MDLNYAHQLMVTIEQQGGTTYRVTGLRGCKEVQRLAAAGLVEISLQKSEDEPAVSIERLTDLGRAFLQHFAESPPLPLTIEDGRRPAHEPLSSAAMTAAKWRTKFASMRMNELPW